MPTSLRKCRKQKPAEQFYLNRLVSDGLSIYCKECAEVRTAAATSV